jgi:hypothetical protein
MEKTEEILQERGSRYGNYLDQATITEELRQVIHLGLKGRRLKADQCDALHMIAVKISRICNGDPDYADNWRDIAGYATLVAERLEGEDR